MRSKIGVQGKISTTVIRKSDMNNASLRALWFGGSPLASGLTPDVRSWRWRNLSNLLSGWIRVRLAMIASKVIGLPVAYGALSITKHNGRTGLSEYYGLASYKFVTDTGVAFIVDAFQNLTELDTMRFHGIGIGILNENQTDAALGTELTTEYNPNGVRATGTLAEGNTANKFQTVGVNILDIGTPAITEHGIFSAATGGVLLDRSKFGSINLNGLNGDALQTTYTLEILAGG